MFVLLFIRETSVFVLLMLRAYVCAYAYVLVKTCLKTTLSFHLQVQKINNLK